MTDMTSAMDRSRYLTACHEAGHAVAAMMRGGGTFTSVTIEPTSEYHGRTTWSGKRWDVDFITFAGPWAQARADWGKPTLNGWDDSGCEFDDYVLGALMDNPDDTEMMYCDEVQKACDAAVDEMYRQNPDALRHSREAAEHIRQGGTIRTFRERFWSRVELERAWPVIREVAQMLLDGAIVTPETVNDLLYRDE